MRRRNALAWAAVLFAFAAGACGARAVVAAAPSFTISGTNATMPSSGMTSIPFSLMSVNGFAGTVRVAVTAPNPPAGVRPPYLDLGGPALTYTLAANAMVTGGIGVSASEPLPVAVQWKQPRRGAKAIWAMAGLLMLGFALRRKRALGSTRFLLGVVMLVGLMGMGACGGPPTLTPGTYSYTLTASGQDNAAVSASTTVTVTVPAGIVTRSSGD